MSAVAFGDGREPGKGLRWTLAALLVAGVHAGAGWWLLGHAFAPPPPPEGPPAVTVELAPISVPAPPTAEPKPMENAGPGREPQVAEAPETQPEQNRPAADAPPPLPSAANSPPVEAAVAPPPEPAPPVPQQKPEPTPTPIPVPEVVPPNAPATSDAVLAPPPPARPIPPVKKIAAPKSPRPAPPKPDARDLARQQAREEKVEAREEARREAKAQAAVEARAQRQAARDQARAARAAAAREGGGADQDSAAPRASGASVASWRGELAAHLRAYKPDVQVASGGTAVVTITIDGGGRVVSASLTRSSGDGTLDQAAVAMMHRASPVPAPPPEAGRQTIPVPVRFY